MRTQALTEFHWLRSHTPPLPTPPAVKMLSVLWVEFSSLQGDQIRMKSSARMDPEPPIAGVLQEEGVKTQAAGTG